MRKSILIVFVLFATFQISIAQDAIAKLKFQDAEEAYTNNNYVLTISKLDDVEVLLKATNPKLLHLRILATNKLAQSPEYSEDPEIITQLKNNCNTYLKKYETLENNEDKYREVYKISEAAKNYKCDESLYLKAKNGDSESQFNLGFFYGEKGREESAIEWYERAANSGNVKAMINLGWAYQTVKKDTTTAIKWYEKAAAKEDPLAMKLLGDLYSKDNGAILKNSEKALFWYRKASDLGYIPAMRKLGDIYRDGKIVPINGITALDWYTKGVETKPKDENDKKHIGNMYFAMMDLYYRDDALEKDYAKVKEIATNYREIINDDKVTLAYLGEIYRTGGFGIEKDTDKSFEYYNEAFKSGETAFNLIGMAEMYHKGYGTAKTVKKGSLPAVSLIGGFNSYGPSKDKNKANELFVKAIERYKKSANNSENAIYSIKKLIQIYEEGIGCSKNKKEASYWRTKLDNLK